MLEASGVLNTFLSSHFPAAAPGERHAHRHQDESGGRQASIDATLLQPTALPQASWATYGAARVVRACVGRWRRAGRAMATPGCAENAMLIDTRMNLEDGRRL